MKEIFGYFLFGAGFVAAVRGVVNTTDNSDLIGIIGIIMVLTSIEWIVSGKIERLLKKQN